MYGQSTDNDNRQTVESAPLECEHCLAARLCMESGVILCEDLGDLHEYEEEVTG